MPPFIFIVIPTERYGFGSFEPIGFETEAEADDFIRLMNEANELANINIKYNKHLVMINSRRKREEARARILASKE